MLTTREAIARESKDMEIVSEQTFVVDCLNLLKKSIEPKVGPVKLYINQNAQLICKTDKEILVGIDTIYTRFKSDVPEYCFERLIGIEEFYETENAIGKTCIRKLLNEFKQDAPDVHNVIKILEETRHVAVKYDFFFGILVHPYLHFSAYLTLFEDQHFEYLSDYVTALTHPVLGNLINLLLCYSSDAVCSKALPKAIYTAKDINQFIQILREDLISKISLNTQLKEIERELRSLRGDLCASKLITAEKTEKLTALIKSIGRHESSSVAFIVEAYSHQFNSECTLDDFINKLEVRQLANRIAFRKIKQALCQQPERTPLDPSAEEKLTQQINRNLLKLIMAVQDKFWHRSCKEFCKSPIFIKFISAMFENGVMLLDEKAWKADMYAAMKAGYHEYFVKPMVELDKYLPVDGVTDVVAGYLAPAEFVEQARKQIVAQRPPQVSTHHAALYSKKSLAQPSLADVTSSLSIPRAGEG